MSKNGLSERVKKTAHRECACFIGGECCFGHPCRYDNVMAAGDELPRCGYFETHILPADPSLEAEYWKARGKDDAEENDVQAARDFRDVANDTVWKTCARCKERVRMKRNGKYCDECRTAAVRQSKRESARRRRERKTG